MSKLQKIEDAYWGNVTLSQDEEELLVSLSSGGYSMVRPPGKNSWTQYTSESGIPQYFFDVARSIIETEGKDMDAAIPEAFKRVKAWSEGKRGVTVVTQEKARRAMLAWMRLVEQHKKTKKLPVENTKK